MAEVTTKITKEEMYWYAHGLDRFVQKMRSSLQELPESVRQESLSIVNTMHRMTQGVLKDQVRSNSYVRGFFVEHAQSLLGAAPKKEEPAADKTEPTKPEPKPPKTDPEPDPKPNPRSGGNRKGMKGVDDYRNVTFLLSAISGMKAGDTCPNCKDFKLRADNSDYIRFHARSPIEPVHHRVEKLRCDLCGALFCADVPAEIKKVIGRFTPGAAAAAALYKYYWGLPSYRLENITDAFGNYISDSTLWEIIKKFGEYLDPILKELEYQIANAKLIHDDDASHLIVEHLKQIKAELELAIALGKGKKSVRTGINSTVIVATLQNGSKCGRPPRAYLNQAENIKVKS